MSYESDWRERVDAAVRLTCGVISGPSACRLWGGEADWNSRQIHVTVDRTSGFRRVPGLVIHRQDVGQHEIAMLDGVPVCSPLRTVEDCAIHATGVQTVICIETLARRGLVTIAEICRRIAERGPWGTRKLSSAVSQVDLRSESGSETELRLLVQPHLSTLDLQVVVRHEDREARLDLAEEDIRLGLEANGREYHAENFEYDQDRRLFLRRAGWELLDFTAKRIRTSPAYVLRCVLEVAEERRRQLYA